MSLALEDFYERELAALGDLARDFSRRYPAEAGRLVPDPSRSIDPHLERFVEGFALLAGRVHHKLDDEFPELTGALLEILYPHLLAPIPPMAIAQFEIDPRQPPAPAGVVFDKKTRLHTPPVGNPPLPCRWRTGYPVTLWPVQVNAAQLQRPPFPAGLTVPPRTVALLRLQLECLAPGGFAALPLDKLRFHLNGDKQVIANLYEVIFNHTLQVTFRSLDSNVKRPPLVLPAAACLSQVGLGIDEGLLPFPEVSFVGYRLLTEFLSFRDKFWFVDLGGWRPVVEAGFGQKVEVMLFLNRAQENLEQGIDARTFLLGCTPIINLFAKSAEPIAVTQRGTSYRVVPSRTHTEGMEVFSVDSVTAFDPADRRLTDYQPFYAFGPKQSREGSYAFWFASRRESLQPGDRGTEVYLTLVDSEFNPRQPAEAVLDVRTTTSNRDWPSRFQRGGELLLLDPGARAASGPIRCLAIPTQPLRPPLRRGAHWRLLAQNGLNHVSLTEAEEGRQALQEMLRLCDCTEAGALRAVVNQQIIEGLQGMQCRRVLGRASSSGKVGICRGLEFTLEFDEKKYVGVGLFLFACVLERFLGLYGAVNSFSQVIARTKQGDYIKKWPPRAAANQLL